MRKKRRLPEDVVCPPVDFGEWTKGDLERIGWL